MGKWRVGGLSMKREYMMASPMRRLLRHLGRHVALERCFSRNRENAGACRAPPSSVVFMAYNVIAPRPRGRLSGANLGHQHQPS